MSSEFLKLGIDKNLVDILKQNGITEPTPIQEQAIPVLFTGKDILAQSQTGTGKTLAFLLPIVQRLKGDLPFIQALIITPTRELALQIRNEAEKLAEPLGLNVLPLYGGQDVERQSKRLKGEAHIVIGTPGRILDHVNRKTVDFSHVNYLVLDEADQMINLGFIEDVREIIKGTSQNRQTMLFSATLPKGMRAIASHFMKKPVDVRVHSSKVTLEEIQQIVIETKEDQKLDTLCSLIDQFNPYLAIVFAGSKERASMLNGELIKRGYLSDELHGDLSQSKRQQVMRRFREAKIQILVSSDIAARGIDVEGVSHVFNYDVPQDVKWYIHRIGRTGRAGQEGIAVTLVSSAEYSLIRNIESGINMTIDKWGVIENNPLEERVIYGPKKREEKPQKPVVEQKKTKAQAPRSKFKPEVKEKKNSLSKHLKKKKK